MATRKSFVELIVPESTIARGANTVGGTVIGDYLVDGHRVVVVRMPKVEKKAGSKKRQKPATPKAESAQRIEDEKNMEVRYGA